MISRFYRDINGAKDPHTYQETVIGQEINTDDSLNLYLSPAGMYYKNNFTLFSMMGNIESDYKQYMYLYNHKINKVTIAYDWGSFPIGDYHSSAFTLILKDGRILTANETQHNQSFVIKRSLKPYDITSFETLANINGDIAYPFLSVVGDRIYIVCRSFPLIENAVFYSDDWGETWSEPKPILNTGTYANYWAYIRMIYNPKRLQYFMIRRDNVGTGLFDKIYFLQSIDGVNWFNIDNSYNRNIDVLKLSASDLEDYYKVKDISPAGTPPKAVSQVNNSPFYLKTSSITDGSLEFGYFNGSTWQSKEITIVDLPLRDANRMALFAESETKFTVYCTSYEAFAVPTIDTLSPIVKITTTNAFDTYTHELMTDGTSFDYNVGVASNVNEFNKSAVICTTPKVYGSGSDVEPLNSYSVFKIIDVL